MNKQTTIRQVFRVFSVFLLEIQPFSGGQEVFPQVFPVFPQSDRWACRNTGNTPAKQRCSRNVAFFCAGTPGTPGTP